MGAARVFTGSRLRYTALAAAAAGVHASLRRASICRFDSPAALPQDASLISHGRRAQSNSTQSHRKAAQHTKRGDAELVDKTNDPDSYAPAFEDDDENAWASFSRNFDNVREGLARIQWTSIGDTITDFVLPSWAKFVPDGIQKLQFELSTGPGTLADEIWQEAHDPNINPEILWSAKVRVGDTLGADELAFREKRRQRVVKALAKYLDIPEKDIDPEDVPTIAMCGSGGGLRALVAGTSSYYSAQQDGLFDCVMYTAGVSGSCWLQTLFYSSIGKQSHAQMLKHLKSRIGTHIAFPPAALKLVTSAPTNKYILSGFVEKLKGDPGASFGLVNVYSALLTARLLVPNGDLDVHNHDLKLSNQRTYIENGEFPMPIYTAVRHEIPVDDEELEQSKDDLATKQKIKDKARREAWFQWFELHPWEVWCEEFSAGIPTWALGRPFNAGTNQIMEDSGLALPETRQSLLLGIYGSAFCATLAHYYKEMKPILVGMTGFRTLDGLISDKNDDLVKIHPIEPATIPNFVYGMRDVLPDTCPDSVFRTQHLQLMDAGMSNNLPIYPLLRPGRDVDIIIAFDASADIQKENWLSVVDGYAKQRGVKGWPVGAGWPKPTSRPEEHAKALDAAQAATTQEATDKLAEARERGRENSEADTKKSTAESPTTGDEPDKSSNLGSCSVWVGTKEERETEDEPPPSRRIGWEDPDDGSFHLTQPNAGIAVVYFPLLPNKKVEGVDPDTTDYLSTWNFIYTPEQVDKVVELAKTNFEEGKDITKRTVRAVYERKKQLRLARKKQSEANEWREKLREHGDAFTGS